MSHSLQFDITHSVLPPGLSVIEASAGTGKTYAISHLVPRLLLDGTVEALGEVLLVTFTNDAARELSERVRRVLEKLASEPVPDEANCEPGVHQLRREFLGSEAGRSKVKRALEAIDQLSVSTIHSFCQRTLQAEGTLCGVPATLELITDSSSQVDEFLHDLWEKRVAKSAELSALAVHFKWSLESSLRFVRDVLAFARWEPEATGVEGLFAQKSNYLARMKAGLARWGADFKALTDLVAEVGEAWTTKCPDAATRDQYLAALSEAATFDCPGFLPALDWVAGLEDFINGQFKVGKEAKPRARELRMVQWAKGLNQSLKIEWLNHCVGLARATVHSMLKANRQITQDGLITTLHGALVSGEASANQLASQLRSRYTVALIDESQDTDRRQFEIFARIFLPDNAAGNKHRLVLVGDPKQAIYGFRGADLNTYIEARNRAGNEAGGAIYTLNRTFRSPQPLVDAVNAVFRRPGALLAQGIGFEDATSGMETDRYLVRRGVEVPGRFEAWIVPADRAEAFVNSKPRLRAIVRTVASEIVRILCDGEIQDGGSLHSVEPKDFAVLVSTGRQAAAMADALRERGVPAVVGTGDDVLASDEAAEMLALLRAMRTPRRAKIRYAALVTRLLGVSAERLHSIRSNEDAQDEIWIDRFTDWNGIWERYGIAVAMGRIDRECGIVARLAASPEGERRVTNYRQLVDVLQRAVHEEAARPEHLTRWLAQGIQRAESHDTPEERQMQLESDEAAVQILTMHKAKGLEFNLVFCPFLWDMGWDKAEFTRFSAGAGAGRVDMMLLSNRLDPDTRTAVRRAALEDRIRLAYVALTRAKVRTWIFGGNMGPDSGVHTLKPSALDWLLRDKKSGEEGLVEFGPFWLNDFQFNQRSAIHAGTLAGLHPRIRVENPPAISWDRWESTPKGEAPALLPALEVPRIETAWGITSFTAITREKHRHGTAELVAGSVPAGPAPAAARAQMLKLAGIRGGAALGTLVHEWLERWDFSVPGPATMAALQEHVRGYREFHNSNGSELESALYEMLEHLRSTTLPGLECSVAEACPFPTASEWNFHLKLKGALDVDRVASAFEQNPDSRFRDYHQSLRLLAPGEMRGYLQGFLDRIVFHAGRWGVADWKTNTVRDPVTGAPDYSDTGLIRCAMDNHYLLQMHLYLVALRRFLRRAPSGHSNAGAYLIFLRAVQAGTPAGVLHLNPAPALLDALESCFDGGTLQ